MTRNLRTNHGMFVVGMTVAALGVGALIAPRAHAQPPTKSGKTKAGPAVPAAKQPEPTTIAQAVKVVDLLTLPRVNVANVFNESATEVSYQAKAGLKSADAFYRETLEEEGWKSAGVEDRSTAEYVDRLYQKNGYYLRVTVGTGGEKGLVFVSVSNLGNIDVRQFARHGNAPLNEGSTPVNMAYFTKIGLAEAGKYCQEQFTRLGWKEFKDEAAPGNDVAHVKMFQFRKNDARIQAIVYRDPNKLEEGPTSIAILSMSVAAPPAAEKPPAAAVAANRPPRPAAKPAATESDDDNVPAKPAPAKSDDDDEDLGAKIRKEIQDTIDKQLGDLKKELGGLDLGKSVPGKGKVPSAKSKVTAPKIPRPSPSDDDDDDGDRKKKPSEASRPLYFAMGKCQGAITYDGKKYPLKHAVAIRYQERDDLVTIIYCGGNAFKSDKLKRGKPGDVSLFDLVGFDAPPSLSFRFTKDYASFNSYVEGASISVGSTKIKNEIELADGHLKGKAFLDEPEEFFKKEFLFELTVDLVAEAADTSKTTPTPDADALVPDEGYDLPVPENRSEVSQERSPYRTVLSARVEATLDRALKFYRTQLAKKKYVENGKAARITKDSANLTFAGPSGPLSVSLKTDDANTAIELVTRNEELAKKHGILPKAGQARLMLGNGSESAAVVVIDGKEHKLDAGVGGRDPQSAVKVDIKPGKHKVVVKVEGEEPQTEEIEVPADAVWGVIVTPPGFALVTRVY